MKNIIKILHLAAVLLLLAGVISCGKEENENNELVLLKGTKWKLAGIVDVQTGKLTELEPKNCEQCYTLEFDTDSTASGFSTGNKMGVCLSQSCISKGHIIGIETFAGEIDDGWIFTDILLTVDAYCIKKNDIKFFFNNKQNYLLYKLIQP